MRPISFLHCADLHLDRPFSGANRLPNSIHEFVRDSAYRSLRRIVDLAISNKVDFVLFAGDLFDTSYRSLKAQMTLLIELQRLHNAGIHSYLSHGNHDALDGEWVSLTWPESSYFFSSNVEAIPFEQDGKRLAYIHAFSYPSRHVNEKMVDRYSRVEESVYQIGMLHGNLEGQTEHSSYAPFSLSELVEKDFDYWALGHIHKRAHLLEEPPVIYPGNIQGAHRKETGAKGCYLVTLSEASPSTAFHQTSDVTWHRPTIDLGAFETMQDLLQACEDLLNQDLFASGGHLIEIELTGISHLHTQLLQEDQLEDLLLALQLNREVEDNHFVWPYKFSLKSQPAWDRQVLEQQEGFIKDILVKSDDYKEKNLQEALAPLYEHRRARKALETIDDQDQLVKEAEELLLSYLVENNGGDIK
ncbi:metallophosphoesterase family protein [Guptibacillus hwajinpoensis]|uniref:DNA repair exonuclease SbcCD nuclease subunit n=1 Tax=Guptibacillus hwajinpoensis TaxID=208199 RepID=A0ABU0K5P5_9BACL|nr:DNA repair exonuclease [Alkalihalobacillus hemicentroti]MDQ0484686.1 DNA repair exonuclease SbcCD nuclease subunit [Alkalihalobacillus hemicentroti]